jgi:hypothetical protein
LDQIIFGIFVLLGLAVDMESRAGENTSDISLIIAFFLVFFRGIIIVVK